MGFFMMQGTGGTGTPLVKPKMLELICRPSLVEAFDFSRFDTLGFDAAGLINTVKGLKTGNTFIRAGISASAGYVRTALADGQYGTSFASNRGSFVGQVDQWPTSSFTAVAVFQQNVGSDGVGIASNDDTDPFSVGWQATNAARVYTKYSEIFKDPASSTNDGALNYLMAVYDATASTLAVYLNGVLKQTFAAVAAPVHTNKAIRLGSVRTTGSVASVVIEGVLHSAWLFSEAGADGGALVTGIKQAVAEAFPSRGFVTT